jgi:hypothetical protein
MTSYDLKMIQTTREKMRALFPHIKDEELDAAHERLKRLAAIAIDMARNQERRPLTEDLTEGNLKTGPVDPSISTTISG